LISIYLGLDSELAAGEVGELLLLLDGLSVLVGSGESTADSTGLLLTEVDGDKARVREGLAGAASVLAEGDADSSALLLVDHGQNASNRLAHNLDLGELAGSSSGDLSNAELLEFGLKVLELLQKLVTLLVAQIVGLDLGHR